MLNLRKNLFKFYFYLAFNRILAISLRWWLILILLALLIFLIVFLQNFIWPIVILIFGMFFEFGARFSSRSRYSTFIASNSIHDQSEFWNQIQAGQEIPVQVTGLFSDDKRDFDLFLANGKIQKYPIGDLYITVEYAEGKFCYQFISNEGISKLELGQFWIGPEAFEKTYRITYKTTWSNKVSQEGISYYVGAQFIKGVDTQLFLSFV